MSVIIEGEARKSVWKGSWYFAKEREPRRDFEYKRSGNTIPKELLDYVSFVNPNAGNSNRVLANRFRGGNIIGGKKRGRPIGKDRNVVPKAAPGDSAPSSSEKRDYVDAEVVGGGSTHPTTAAPENDGDSENEETNGDTLKTPGATDNSDTPNPPGVAETSRRFVEIDETHELFGLWEGSFDVAPVEGPGNEDAHKVKETFFFYSFLGVPPKSDLSSLPAEAHYTYSALKAITVPVLPPSQAPENGTSSTSTAKTDNGEVSQGGDAKSEAVKATKAVGEAVSVKKEADADGEVRARGENGSISGSNDSSNGALKTEAAIVSTPGVDKAATSTDAGQETLAVEEGGVDADSDDIPLITDGSHPCGLVVMVGFGKNHFGRFSLTATLDPSKNTLIAEKRYMLSKSATLQRKGRKSESLEPGSGPSTRPRTSSLVDVLNLGTQKKKRSNSGMNKRDSGYLYDEGYASGLGPASGGRGGSRRGNGSGGGLGGPGIYEASPGGIPRGPLTDLFEELPEDSEDPEYKQAIYDEVSGEVYEGGWSYGYRHGRGVCLYTDGSMYEGSWSRGKEHGRGQLMCGDRKVIYMGEWQDGAMHGHGTYHFYSGDKYVGDFREGARHGKGEFLSRDGCCYLGDWRDNKRCGRGIFSWPDGSYYDGEWENDTRHGKGRLWLKSGFEYDGSWLNNSFDSRGIAIFPNGQRYEGSYKYGTREGRGSITFAEGAVYEGRFREDRLDGQGTIKVSNVVPGVEDGEKLIPIEIQADIRRIHLKAGFGAAESH